LTHWTQLSLGLTISFSPCSAEKEDRSRGIIRKEKERRDPKMEDASRTGEEDEARRIDRREKVREREKRERKKIRQ